MGAWGLSCALAELSPGPTTAAESESRLWAAKSDFSERSGDLDFYVKFPTFSMLAGPFTFFQVSVSQIKHVFCQILPLVTPLLKILLIVFKIRLLHGSLGQIRVCSRASWKQMHMRVHGAGIYQGHAAGHQGESMEEASLARGLSRKMISGTASWQGNSGV